MAKNLGRPKKHKIDSDKVYKLASYGCSNVEIADFFNVDESVVRKTYSEFITKGRVDMKHKLRKAQFHRAIGNFKYKKDKEGNKLFDDLGQPEVEFNNDGSVPLLIWLGKQMLGQTDTATEDKDELCNGFEVGEI